MTAEEQFLRALFNQWEQGANSARPWPSCPSAPALYQAVPLTVETMESPAPSECAESPLEDLLLAFLQSPRAETSTASVQVRGPYSLRVVARVSLPDEPSEAGVRRSEP